MEDALDSQLLEHAGDQVSLARGHASRDEQDVEL